MLQRIYFNDREVGIVKLGKDREKIRVFYHFVDPRDLNEVLTSLDSTPIEFLSAKNFFRYQKTDGRLKKSLHDGYHMISCGR